MKLYQMDISPFTARCRLAIYAKGVEDKVEIIDPGSVKTAEYKAINPMGKIPALVTADGQAIPESDVICEYLEDMFPTPGLTPADKANLRLVSRVADIYVLNAMDPLFEVAKGGPRVPELLTYGVQKTNWGLDRLEEVLVGPYAAGENLTYADGTVIAAIFYLLGVGKAFGVGDAIDNRPKLNAYWKFIQTNEHAARIIKEMQDAMKKLMGK